MNPIFLELVRGIVIGAIYFEVTGTNDTTLYNIGMYAVFFVVLIRGAKLVGIDSNVVANAFLTKTVFTLVDERIKRPKDEPNKS